ncbi:MAG: ribonuclease R family protein [Pseudanabaena sp.]|jgi:ribonuclease R|nr:VacB/RNase II family 3'-5' exoribonuclease [Pseudanabaena sp. M53BS1SP1A06MG]MCA6580761.1 VacB/RNase II family 3'-5' exoribonuclease [Pseudanabaena sp. M34BS1SP1A06MG]MCA6586359.1 VacB/RNase II family 3'-5' exoribonuclease [Pseudanabaena sp. M051S1SP1A06QC]MCA6587780.1 VacB/RNase II family 3'-5' exoribonuclease [Pseudanabaena sp. M109S1SP1A06QC]MCA6591604.1 VacB/RNase II family 3'-5' exoribonuclease [Pseudanabaena sp. M38BS1SP1A06MG]MCA6595760.1 VacB/RNase II family 3'-5' exoribonuclease [P
MEFSITQLLDNFSDDKLVTPKAIEKKLGISDDSKSVRKLQVALDALEKIGILEKDKGRYRRIHEEGLVEGRLRCSSKGFCFAIQDVEGAEDIYVRESRLSNAWNGDRVLVRVTKDGVRRRSPEGEVRLILERSNPTLLSTVKLTDGSYRAVPLDDRLLFEVELVPDEETPDLSVAFGKLVHLEMVRFSLGNHLPLGRILQVLGDDAESTNDIDLVCCKHNLPRRFSAKALTAAASLPRGVRKADLKHRLDLRKTLTVRIGNAAAISITQSETGWELGVHIPDVATYVIAGSPLDLEARKRLRSFFLGDTILPMLPEMNVFNQPEYLTMSVLIKLDHDGNVHSFEIQPSAILVRANLSYQRAQQILDGKVTVDEDAPSQEIDTEVEELVHLIAKVGSLLQNHSNAIRLVLPQIPSQEADEGVRGLTVVPLTLPISGTVTEVMILANKAIALHLQSLAIPAIYLRQVPPDQGKVDDWLKLLDSMGISAQLETPEQIQVADLHRILHQINQLGQEATRDILKYLLLSMFKPNEYVLAPAIHFGLGLIEQPYIHGVFPQHHYGDLLIQRTLHTVFEEGRDRRSIRIKDGVNLRSSTAHGQVNWSVLPPETERQLIEDLEAILPKLNQADTLYHRSISDLDGLRKAEFMRSHTGGNFYGIITSVQSYGFFVEIESLLVEGLVHVSSLKDDWYEFPLINGKGRARASTLLVGRRSGRQYCLGDRVEVQVKGVDYYRQQIDLVAVVTPEDDRDSSTSEFSSISEADLEIPEDIEAANIE